MFQGREAKPSPVFSRGLRRLRSNSDVMFDDMKKIFKAPDKKT